MAKDDRVRQPLIIGEGSNLVAWISCQCGEHRTRTAAVIPGFVFSCTGCGQSVDKGLVIACDGCHSTSCGDCVYRGFVAFFMGKVKPS